VHIIYRAYGGLYFSKELAPAQLIEAGGAGFQLLREPVTCGIYWMHRPAAVHLDQSFGFPVDQLVA
jgi:hypothetical protein